MFSSPDFLKNFNITFDNLISLINKLLDIKNIDSPFYENNIYSPFNIRNYYSPQNSLISIKSFNLINVSNNTKGSFTFNNIESQIYNFNLYNSYIIGQHITDFSFLYNKYIEGQRIKLIMYFNDFSLSQYLTSDDYDTNPIIFSLNQGLSQEAYFMYPTIRPYGLRT